MLRAAAVLARDRPRPNQTSKVILPITEIIVRRTTRNMLRSVASLITSRGAAAVASTSACSRFAVSVEVSNNNVEEALSKLRRKCMEADLPQEIRKRAHHLMPSERRYQSQTKSYNRAMGRVINQRIHWLAKRRLVK